MSIIAFLTNLTGGMSLPLAESSRGPLLNSHTLFPAKALPLNPSTRVWSV